MKVTWILAVSAAIASGVFTGSSLLGQSASPVAGEFEQDVMPVLSKHCVRCHSDRQQTGKLSLEGFRDSAAARQHPEVWQKVLDKITTGQMPPRPTAPLVVRRRRLGVGMDSNAVRDYGDARDGVGVRSWTSHVAPAEPRGIQQHRFAICLASPSARPTSFRSTTQVTGSTTSATCCLSRRC